MLRPPYTALAAGEDCGDLVPPVGVQVTHRGKISKTHESGLAVKWKLPVDERPSLVIANGWDGGRENARFDRAEPDWGRRT